MLKVHAFLTRLDRLDDAGFFAHWLHPHGTLTKAIPQIGRYVQNRALDGGDLPGLSGGGWTGIATIWVADQAALADAMAHPDYPPLDADGDNMYIRDRTIWLPARETILVDGGGDAATERAKAILFLKSGARTLSGDALAAFAGEAQRRMPGLTDLRTMLPEGEGPAFDGVLELGFADRDALEASWRTGSGDLLRAMGAAVDLAGSRGFRSLERRVIWPEDCLEMETI